MTSFANTLRTASIGGMALVYTALTFGATLAPTPAYAASGVYYRAELAQPVETKTEVVRGTAWSCKGNICVARKSNSRPVIVCQRAAREFGDITSFTVKGEAIAEDKLAKCQGK
ncbi:CC_3452 family protein [Parerythrobacter jejuensis]|uniref:Uncharacterized protein n=1 Tax=Parerythrobacter jejuensis TaxID=795812 RepID=A0A845APU7_9SPHN|nr:hypothetical protein [Parerythrobacter jejuensis]MXP30516.1 hypothetical protein [Parerythrobacter jejuensis]MXP33276.1 hypothetical protein [Parerythrobacter jejuensis]